MGPHRWAALSPQGDIPVMLKVFFRYTKLRGPQELRQRAWDCPLRSFDGYRSSFWFLPGFRGVFTWFFVTFRLC